MDKQLDLIQQFLRDNPKAAALGMGALFGFGVVCYG